jgi:hypothetical protein
MLHNWSGQVNDPVLVKFYLGSVRVEHSIQQAIHEKCTMKAGTKKDVLTTYFAIKCSMRQILSSRQETQQPRHVYM